MQSEKIKTSSPRFKFDIKLHWHEMYLVRVSYMEKIIIMTILFSVMVVSEHRRAMTGGGDAD